MSSAHGACLHVCAKTQVLSRTFVFIFCIDFRVDYESAVEGFPSRTLAAWSQAAFGTRCSVGLP